MRTISGLSGNRPETKETRDNDGDAAGAKELMDGVDIGDSFIVSHGENVTKEVNDNNVFIFANENISRNWGPEIDTETGLEVGLNVCRPVSFHTVHIDR